MKGAFVTMRKGMGLGFYAQKDSTEGWRGLGKGLAQLLHLPRAYKAAV